MRQSKIIVEKHPDGYVAYPLGFKGVVVGEGDTYEEALADVKGDAEIDVPVQITLLMRGQEAVIVVMHLIEIDVIRLQSPHAVTCRAADMIRACAAVVGSRTHRNAPPAV